jgi:predicted nucleotidyltransferase component of viral defense system
MKESPFFNQAKLMLRCMPEVAKEPCFALKGGTAINMFVWNMTRLSVDIDLTYVAIEDRLTSLQNMQTALNNIANNIEKRVPNAKVQRTKRENRIIKLVVSSPGAYIKIEPNEVLRGTTSPPEIRGLVKAGQELFGMDVNTPVVPLADLFGGKIVAALDRQHPRDLYDVKLLFDNGGITDEIRKGFIVFLSSHDRPMHEVIFPNLKDIKQIYEKEFVGMTAEQVSLQKLYSTREQLIETLKNSITTDEKLFLISLKSGAPNWSLLKIDGIDKFPGILWKLQNIQKMDSKKKTEQLKKLEAVLK